MGLKGYRLWVNLIQRAEPHLDLEALEVVELGLVALELRQVALQVAFERRTLKPVFSLDRL
jgi:hypothetical protein